MKRIWKYELELPTLRVTDHVDVWMPVGAKVLSAGNQDGKLCVWVECNTEAPREMVSFVVAGTGRRLPDKLGRFIGTVVMPPFVWHVYHARPEGGQ